MFHHKAEGFNPYDRKKYKKLEDLPEYARKDFVKDKDGFMKKEVVKYEKDAKARAEQLNKHRPGKGIKDKMKKILAGESNEFTAEDIYRKDAESENGEWESQEIRKLRQEIRNSIRHEENGPEN